ncbi:NosD domain-containing protein [Thermoproteota archaeon]
MTKVNRSNAPSASGLFLFLILFVSLCAVCVSGASFLMSETVSSESSFDSLLPVFDIDSDGVIYAVWEDDTDLSSVGQASNGLDKDIFFNYREGLWSTRSMQGGVSVGGSQVISGSDLVSSIQPDIAVDSNKVGHIVWSSIELPEELDPDSNTMFLAHFNTESSLSNADYARGDSSATAGSSSITSNALINNSVLLQGTGSYVEFNADNNYNNTIGTIEFWFNLQDDIQKESESSLLFAMYNSTNTSNFLGISTKGMHQPYILLDVYGQTLMKSEPSYIYPIKNNEWHHIALTYDMSNPTAVLKLYIDGYLADSLSIAMSPPVLNRMSVGSPDSSQNINAKIDEFMIFDIVRSEQEIKQHAGNRSIFYKTVTNKTSFSSRTKLTLGQNLSYYPRIAVDTSDNLHLVYNEIKNRSSVSVMYMIKNSTDWSEPELLSNTFIAYMPDIAADSSDDAHVVWEEFSDSDYNISYIHYEKRESGSWGTEENVSTPSYSSFASHDAYGRRTIAGYFPKKPVIAVDSSNTAKVVWSDNIDYPDPDLSFYASYDGTRDAEYSGGTGTAESAATSFNDGTNGSYYNKEFFDTQQGIDVVNYSTNISKSAHLNYSSVSNFNISKGAVSMWVRPYFNPSYEDINQSNVLFSSISNTQDTEKNSMILSLTRYGGYAIVAMQIYDKDYTAAEMLDHIFFYAVSARGLNQSEWHHIGFSWDINNSDNERDINITIDGIQKEDYAVNPDNDNAVPIDTSHDRFFVGALYNLTLGYINQSNSTIDEFKIFSNPRSAEQFYGDMVMDYDVFYRQRNSTDWSDVSLVSTDSNFMALNPAIADLGGTAYITWSEAQGECDLSSSEYKYCTAFSTVSAFYNGSVHLLGSVSDEDDEESFSPYTGTYSSSIFYIWEGSRDYLASDMDVLFIHTANSTKPFVNITSSLENRIFQITNFSMSGYNISLNATASDTEGTLANVTFYYTTDELTGDIACTDDSAPYSCKWDILPVAEDYYKIKAVATSTDSGRNWDLTENYFYIDSSPGVATYILNSSTSNKAYEDGYASLSQRPNVSTGSLGTLISDLDNFSGMDNIYKSTSLADSCGVHDYINAQTAIFYINESPDDIKSLDIYWKGKGYGTIGYITNISIWNFNTEKWESLAYKDFVEQEDDVLRYTLTENFEDYMPAQNNSVIVLIETEDRKTQGSCGLGIPPCPFYYSWNGTDYVFETEGLLGQLNKHMEATTYDKLNNVGNTGEENGEIKVKIAEILPEILYLNNAGLIAVDHPVGTDVYSDPKGGIHTINPENILPVMCHDRFGNDCSALVENADEMPEKPASSLEGGLVSSRSNFDSPPLDYSGNAWVSDIMNIDLEEDTQDYLYLTLPENIINENVDTIKLIISGSETGLMSFSEFKLFAIGAENLPVIYDAIDNTYLGKIMKDKIGGSAKITVQFLDENDEWKDYPETFDSAILGSYETMMLPLDAEIILQASQISKISQIRLKMTAFSYMIDFIGIDISENKDVIISHYSPEIDDLNDIDDKRIVIKEGEHIELVFEVDEPGDQTTGKQRTYFLETTGYYHPLESLVQEKETQETSTIDIAKTLISNKVYAGMYADSDYGRRYFIEQYLDTDFSRLPEIASEVMSRITGENPTITKNTQHNTLYTDLIKVSTSTCTVPINNMKITEDTILCRGVYSRPDNDYTEGADKIGILQVTGSDITLDCNGSVLKGSGETDPGSQGDDGVAIVVNSSENVVIKNCNISRYTSGITFNNSRNITVINNSLSYLLYGVSSENSNSSNILDNSAYLAGGCAYCLFDNSLYNIVEENNVLDSFIGVAVRNAHYNTIRNNYVHVISASPVYAFGVNIYRGSYYNLIDNNTINNTWLGLGILDIDYFLFNQPAVPSGMWNNFSRNNVSNSGRASLTILPLYSSDYFNYFEQSNTLEGESIYYYVNMHGSASNYTEVKNLDLTEEETSVVAGKLTFVNCSNVDVSDNVLGNNYYNLVIVNSSNMLISNNQLENATPNVGLLDFVTGGIGMLVFNSEYITVTDNTAKDGEYGYSVGFMWGENSGDVNFSSNTASGNSEAGFYILSSNSTYLNNNNATDNTQHGISLNHAADIILNSNFVNGSEYGVYINYSEADLADNTIIENSEAGLYIYNCRNNTYFTSNTIENNTGSGVYLDSCSAVLYSGISTANNSQNGFYIYDSDSIFLRNISSSRNYRGIFIKDTDNSQIIDMFTANNTVAGVQFINALGNSIIDSVIVNNISGYDIVSSDITSNYALNVSFDKSNTDYVGTSNLSVMWHLDFLALDNESAVFDSVIPIMDVNITLNDTFGNNLNLLTGSSGFAHFNITDYVENSTGRRYFSNYTWTLEKEGYNFTSGLMTTQYLEANMSINRFFNLSLLLQGGVEDNDAPTDPVVVDGPDYVDVDWISSRTSLSASWYNSTDRLLIFYSFRILENGTCISDYCSENSAGQDTSVTVTDLNLTEGMNYTFAVRARDSLYYYTPYIFSDGAIADFTAPNVTINSTTHPNQTGWYNEVNATFEFYGSDSLSGVDSFSYILDQDSGTGPDLIEELRPTQTLSELRTTGYHDVLKTNETGEAFAVFYEINGNLTEGDNVTVTFQATEDVSDRMETMQARVYLIDGSETINDYNKLSQAISTTALLSDDISHKAYSSADSYSVSVTVTEHVNESFYVVIAGLDSDDDNTNNFSIAGSDSGVDNSTKAHLCGETSGCTDMSSDAEYSIAVKKQTSGGTWTKNYANLENGVYYFHVRAKDIAGNWGEAEHFKIQIDAVGGAPIMTNIRPRGYVATTSPTLAVETNEYTTCYYSADNITYDSMTSYDGISHEAELSLSEGTYTYHLNCTDRSGNSAYNTTEFVVDPDAVPDTVVIWPMSNYTAGQTITIYVNVTKEYGGVDYGLGELTGFSVNITDTSPATYGVPTDVTDLGNGVYRIRFTGPAEEGIYTLKVGVQGVTDTESFIINTYSLTILYSGSTDSASTSSSIAYGKSNKEYTIGVASDTAPSYISGSTGQLQVKYVSSEGKGFIFMTNPYGDVGKRSKYLDRGTFLDLKRPSFGQDLNKDEHVISTVLDYDSLDILGDDKVSEGRYSILIRNDGVNVSSGKTKITIEII